MFHIEVIYDSHHCHSLGCWITYNLPSILLLFILYLTPYTLHLLLSLKLKGSVSVSSICVSSEEVLHGLG